MIAEQNSALGKWANQNAHEEETVSRASPTTASPAESGDKPSDTAPSPRRPIEERQAPVKIGKSAPVRVAKDAHQSDSDYIANGDLFKQEAKQEGERLNGDSQAHSLVAFGEAVPTNISEELGITTDEDGLYAIKM